MALPSKIAAMKTLAIVATLSVACGCINSEGQSQPKPVQPRPESTQIPPQNMQTEPDNMQIPEMRWGLESARTLNKQSKAVDKTAADFDSCLTAVTQSVTRMHGRSVETEVDQLLGEIVQVQVQADELLGLGNELLAKTDVLGKAVPPAVARYLACADLCRAEAEKGIRSPHQGIISRIFSLF